MIWPYRVHRPHHNFDLSGMAVGTRFIGCPECFFQLPSDVAAAILECPRCLNRMADFYVTESDLKEIK